MWMEINFESETPIYTQLVQAVMKGIAAGELKAGDALPSVRSLAGDLGVNMLTVNKAYQQLKQEGFITIHRKKGAIIESAEARAASEGQLQRMAEKMYPIMLESICRGLTLEDFQRLSATVYHQISIEKE